MKCVQNFLFMKHLQKWRHHWAASFAKWFKFSKRHGLLYHFPSLLVNFYCFNRWSWRKGLSWSFLLLQHVACFVFFSMGFFYLSPLYIHVSIDVHVEVSMSITINVLRWILFPLTWRSLPADFVARINWLDRKVSTHRFSHWRTT